MKNLIEELHKLIAFKDNTDVGDVALIVAKEPKMLFYAYINKIDRDTSRRDEWWHVHFTVLSVPMQKMVWTLRTNQMNGTEIFAMGGEERFMKAVVLDEGPISQAISPEKKTLGLKRVK